MIFPRLPGRATLLNGLRHFATTPLLWGKVVPFKLADIGEGISEVQVVDVFVKEGDRIEEMDNICEVQSDKATVHITSRYAGVVQKVYVTAQEPAQVGQTLVDIALEEEDGEVSPGGGEVSPGEEVSSRVESPPSSPNAGEVLATPATRSLARQHRVDLRDVRPSGEGGYITQADVHRHLRARPPAGNPATDPLPLREEISTREEPPSPPPLPDEVAIAPGDQTIPIVGVRRGMARAMTRAASIPTFSFSEEFELSRLLETRERLREVLSRRSGGAIRLTFLPFFLKSASLALRAYPEVNAHCSADCTVFVRKAAHHIGVAMDTPNGLIVPVVRDVQAKSLAALAEELGRLMEKGARNQLAAADLVDGTFTISNIGAIGAVHGAPILLPPQVAIATLGRLRPLPRFDATGETIRRENILTVSFSADHRVIDGATMVRFANVWKEYVEYPQRMVLDLQ
ncbi:unnamed protein product [Phytomonas sp. EM1]|nr:unnamed protein product [Phytomonas sp. EM1]|eukprot:CCW64434.1 unnamed protein product [Phytomonas sp. isolate EM1]